MWVILGHSVVVAKKSGQPVPGLERRNLGWYARPLATRPLPPQPDLTYKYLDINPYRHTYTILAVPTYPNMLSNNRYHHNNLIVLVTH